VSDLASSHVSVSWTPSDSLICGASKVALSSMPQVIHVATE